MYACSIILDRCLCTKHAFCKNKINFSLCYDLSIYGWSDIKMKRFHIEWESSWGWNYRCRKTTQRCFISRLQIDDRTVEQQPLTYLFIILNLRKIKGQHLDKQYCTFLVCYPRYLCGRFFSFFLKSIPLYTRLMTFNHLGCYGVLNTYTFSLKNPH